jgi:phenylpropionate dioxygenase-like ring-hydroxylating dioxygenase large terminal subunit
MTAVVPDGVVGDPRYADMIVETPSEFRVSTRAYTDPAVFADEMRRVFESTWIYVAHESEVAQAGDYKTVNIGQQPAILTRSQDGKLNVLMNACRHRGSVICREERGNSNSFRCPYHGWVYENTGRLIGIALRNGYPADFGADIEGLHKAPRVANYRGLIFASLNPDVPEIEEHLGWVRKYVDLWIDMSPGQMGRVLRPHRYGYHGNWKFQAENGFDGYHFRFLHESNNKTLDHFGVRPMQVTNNYLVAGRTRAGDNGHGVLEIGELEGMQPAVFDQYKASLAEAYGAERAKAIATRRHIFLFPNVYLMDMNVRVIQPLAVDRTEVYSHYFSLDGVPPIVNEQRLRDLEQRLGTTGLIGPDDVETFGSGQSGMRVTTLKWVNQARGLDRQTVLPNGELEGHYTDELPQRSLYREWIRRMSIAPGGAA